MKIVYCNVHFIHRKVSLVEDYLNNNCIDILILTETHHSSDININLDDYNVYSYNTTQSYAGMIVIVKNNINFVEFNTVFEEQHDIATFVFNVCDKTVRLAACYVAPRALLDVDRFINFNLIIGDLNCRNICFSNSNNNTNGKKLKRFIDLSNLCIFGNDDHTFFHCNNMYSEKLDFVFCDPCLIDYLSSYSVDDLFNSDHMAISFCISKIEKRDTAVNLETKFNFAKADWVNYNKCIEEALNNDPFKSTNNAVYNIESMCEYVTDIIQSASKNNIPVFKKRKKQLPSYIVKMIKLKRKILKQHKLNKDASNSYHIKSTLNYLSKQIKLQISCFEEEKVKLKSDLISRLDDNSTEFYSRINSIIKCKNNNVVHPIIVNEVKYYDPSIIVKQQALYFKQTINNLNTINNNDECIRSVTSKYEDQLLPVFDVVDNSTVKSINTDEIINAIRKIKNFSSAVGPDKISYTQLRYLPISMIQFMCNLFNLILFSGYFPNYWKTTFVIMLPKPNKSKSLPSSYRPISLFSNVAKLFERVIANRLNAFCSLRNLIPIQQAAHRSGTGTIDLLDSVLLKLQQNKNKGETSIVVAFDLEKAFDTVNHDCLIYKLIKADFPVIFVRLISNYLKNRNLVVKNRNCFSDPFVLDSGVPQGGVLSTILFNLYTSDLPSVFSNKISVAMYADDVLLICSNKIPEIATSEMQDNIYNYIDYCNKWRLKVNESKTQCMSISFFKNSRRPMNKLCVNNLYLNWIDELDYLGIVISSNFCFNKHCNKVIAKANKKLYLVRLIYNRTRLTEATKIKLYKLLIRPVFTYACQVLLLYINDSSINKFERIQLKCSKAILGLPTTVSSEYTKKYCVIETVNEFMLNLINKYYEKENTKTKVAI